MEVRRSSKFDKKFANLKFRQKTHKFSIFSRKKFFLKKKSVQKILHKKNPLKLLFLTLFV